MCKGRYSGDWSNVTQRHFRKQATWKGKCFHLSSHLTWLQEKIKNAVSYKLHGSGVLSLAGRPLLFLASYPKSR